MHNAVQPQKTNCPTCGTSLKHVQSRLCPNAEVIREHLRDNTGFEGTLISGDSVYYCCYKSHLVILQKQIMFSMDSDLQATLLCELIHKMHTVDQPTVCYNKCMSWLRTKQLSM